MKFAARASLTAVVLAAAGGLWIAASHAQDSESDWDAIMMLDSAPKTRGSQHRSRHRRREAKRRGGGSALAQRSWHEESADDFALHAGHSFPPLVIRRVGEPDPYVIDVESAEGGFDDDAHAVARDAFGAWEGGPSAHPRLLELIYRATRHFNAPSLHLVSGLRHDRKASRHSHGMAADIVLPGVRDEDLAAFFREQGFTGVGTYPRSGFVHIDVREASYFWVDRSPPGKRWKLHQVRSDESKAADQQAIARGELPVVNPDVLDHALKTRVVRRRPGRKRQASR